MRQNIANVLAAFRDGCVCNEKTCRTDGTRVFSWEDYVDAMQAFGKTVALELNPPGSLSARLLDLEPYMTERAR